MFNNKVAFLILTTNFNLSDCLIKINKIHTLLNKSIGYLRIIFK